MTFDWNYDLGYVDISIPGYVKYAIEHRQYKPHIHPQYSPHQHVPIRFGPKGTRQYAEPADSSPYPSSKDTKYSQSISKRCLYYAQCIDNTIIPVLNELDSQHSQSTKSIMVKSLSLVQK